MILDKCQIENSSPLIDNSVSGDFCAPSMGASQKYTLISFLNATLKPTFPITHVEIQNTDLEKQCIEEKKQIARALLDILDDETIGLKTALTMQEVKRLRKEMKK